MGKRRKPTPSSAKRTSESHAKTPRVPDRDKSGVSKNIASDVATITSPSAARSLRSSARLSNVKNRSNYTSSGYISLPKFRKRNYLSDDEEDADENDDSASESEESDKQSDDDVIASEIEENEDADPVEATKKKIFPQRPKIPDFPDDIDIPVLNLPPSCNDLLIELDDTLDVVGIYEVLHHFSSILRLSPFRFEDFCAALVGKEHCNLLAESHMALLKAVLREEDTNSTVFGPNDAKDSINITLHFVDGMTWFEVARMYLQSLTRGDVQDVLRIFSKDKYQDLNVKQRVVILQSLVDLFLATNSVREALIKEGDFIHEDQCRHCHKRGDLICCETCPAVYHLGCASLIAVPEGEWLCRVCTDHKLKQSGEHTPDANVSTSYLNRRDPIGYDRHSRKYWFLCRRIFVESETETWYYSTEVQLDELLEALDGSHWEADLVAALNDARTVILTHMLITQELTNKVNVHKKTALSIHDETFLEQRRIRKAKEEAEQNQNLEDSKDGDANDTDVNNDNKSTSGSIDDSIGCSDSIGGSETRLTRSATGSLPCQKFSSSGSTFGQYSSTFRLGMEANYKSYVNIYSTNYLALSKQQQCEDRDKRRHLSYKFSLTPLSDFSWTGSPYGLGHQTLECLRKSILHLETSIPSPFVHANWPKHSDRWVKAINMCSTPKEFGLAIMIFEACIKPVIFNSVWHESLGHIKLRRSTLAEREERKKKEKELQKWKKDDTEALWSSWVKYSLGVRHQVWKQKGEDYRITGRGGWIWISITRVSRPMFAGRLGLRLVSQMQQQKVLQGDGIDTKQGQSVDNFDISEALKSRTHYPSVCKPASILDGLLEKRIGQNETAMKLKLHFSTVIENYKSDEDRAKEEVASRNTAEKEESASADDKALPVSNQQELLEDYLKMNKEPEDSDYEETLEKDDQDDCASIESGILEDAIVSEDGRSDPDPNEIVPPVKISLPLECFQQKNESPKPSAGEIEPSENCEALNITNVMRSLQGHLNEGKMSLNPELVSELQTQLDALDKTWNRVSLVWKNSSRRRSSGSLRKNGGIPIAHNFLTHSNSQSLFVLEQNDIRALSRKGGLQEVSGFNYMCKMYDVSWPYPCPRPYFKTAWRYRTQTIKNLAAIALQLRILWTCIRWDDLASKAPSGGISVTESESETTSYELLKRKDVDSSGLRAEYLVQRTVLGMDVPSTSKERIVPQRSGLRERRNQELQKTMEPSVTEIWVPEEQLELWQIKHFAERLAKQSRRKSTKIPEMPKLTASLPKPLQRSQSPTVTPKPLVGKSPALTPQTKTSLDEELQLKRIAMKQRRLQMMKQKEDSDDGPPKLLHFNDPGSSAGASRSLKLPLRTLSQTKTCSQLPPSTNQNHSKSYLKDASFSRTPKEFGYTFALPPVLPPASQSTPLLSSNPSTSSTPSGTVAGQSLRIIKSPDGKMQVFGLLPGQELVQLPDGRLRLVKKQDSQPNEESSEQNTFQISTPNAASESSRNSEPVYSGPTSSSTNQTVMKSPSSTPAAIHSLTSTSSQSGATTSANDSPPAIVATVEKLFQCLSPRRLLAANRDKTADIKGTNLFGSDREKIESAEKENVIKMEEKPLDVMHCQQTELDVKQNNSHGEPAFNNSKKEMISAEFNHTMPHLKPEVTFSMSSLHSVEQNGFQDMPAIQQDVSRNENVLPGEQGTSSRTDFEQDCKVEATRNSELLSPRSYKRKVGFKKAILKKSLEEDLSSYLQGENKSSQDLDSSLDFSDQSPNLMSSHDSGAVSDDPQPIFVKEEMREASGNDPSAVLLSTISALNVEAQHNSELEQLSSSQSSSNSQLGGRDTGHQKQEKRVSFSDEQPNSVHASPRLFQTSTVKNEKEEIVQVLEANIRKRKFNSSSPSHETETVPEEDSLDLPNKSNAVNQNDAPPSLTPESCSSKKRCVQPRKKCVTSSSTFKSTTNDLKKSDAQEDLHCICQTPYDHTKFYVGCDACSRWFHGSCINMTQETASCYGSYVCSECKALKRTAPKVDLYCVCRKPYDESQFYIGCDVCKDWFHGSCVGVTPSDAGRMSSYTCPNCHDDAYNKVALQDHHWPVLKQLLTELKAHPLSVSLMESISKFHRTDFSGVDVRLNEKTYNRLSEFIDDIIAIFSRIRYSSRQRSAIYNAANRLEVFFYNKLKRMKSSAFQL